MAQPIKLESLVAAPAAGFEQPFDMLEACHERVHRMLGNGQDFVRVTNAALAVDRNYAPIYAELGMFYEAARDQARATQAYDAYLLLAPNFADSAEVRKRVQALRTPPPPPPQPAKVPTLRRDTDKKR